MQKMMFISRHEPTDSQRQLAAEKGFELVHVGDRDAFSVDKDEFPGPVCVVHPAAALRLLGFNTPVGVFENANRAALGEPPKFEAVRLVVFRISGPQSRDAAEMCAGIGEITMD